MRCARRSVNLPGTSAARTGTGGVRIATVTVDEHSVPRARATPGER
jgi:hypothetical protein